VLNGSRAFHIPLIASFYVEAQLYVKQHIIHFQNSPLQPLDLAGVEEDVEEEK
jgi:hypothetical protein